MRSLICVSSIVILFFLQTPLGADPLSVGASIRPNPVYVGGNAAITLSIRGDTKGDPQITLPQVDGLDLKLQNSISKSTSIINGRVSMQQEYSILVIAKQLGQFTIPPIQVQLGKSIAQTSPLNLTVEQPPTDPSQSRLEVTPSKNSLYVGEGFTLEVNWYVIPQLMRQQPQVNGMLPFEDLNGIEYQSQRPDGNGRSFQADISGDQVTILEQNVEIGGRSFIAWKMKFLCFINRPGEFIIPSITWQGSITDMFGRTRSNFFAASRSQTFNVEAVPPNAPPSFNGAIGDYQFQVQPLSQNLNDLKVLDPIEIQVQIRGEGRLQSIQPPPLNQLPDFTQDFSISYVEDLGEVQGNQISFKAIIKPKNPDVTEIPAIPFTFFNTATGEYQTVSSQAFPINVEESEIYRQAQDSTQRQSSDEIRLEKDLSGLSPPVDNASVIQPGGLPSWSLIWLLIPLILYAGVLMGWRYYQANHLDPEVQASRGLAKQVQEYLDSASKNSSQPGQFYNQLMNAFATTFQMRFGTGGGELTVKEVQRLADKQELQKHQADFLKNTLETANSIRFGGSTDSTTSQQILQEARAIIKEIMSGR